MTNTMKKLIALFLAVMMLASLSSIAFAAVELSDDNFTFNYTVTSSVPSYEHFSGVKLTWNVPVVRYEEATVIAWNTSELMWEKTFEQTTTNNTVTFTFINRSSYPIKANVSFKPEVEDSASVTFGKEVEDPDDSSKTITTNANDPIIASIVNSDYSLKEETNKEDYVTKNCSAVISGTVSVVADKLAGVSGTLGTYTATIEKVPNTYTVTLVYYKNSDDSDYTTENIPVDEGTTITCSENTITIGTKTYTTAATHTDNFTGWVIESEQITNTVTVTKDMTISAIYQGGGA